MKRLPFSLLLSAGMSLVACGGGGEPTGGSDNSKPLAIASLSGDHQRVAVGATTREALVVKVSDRDGDGVPGQAVTWEVTAGGGGVSSTTTTTGPGGKAAVFVTAGAAEEDNVVTAAVDGVAPLIFTVKAVAPAQLAVSGGNGQVARSNQQLAEPLVTRVIAADNGPVPGATVTWEVTSGDAVLLDSLESTTDGEGLTSNRVQLGTDLGPNAFTATATGTASEASFEVTATLPFTLRVTMQNIAFNAESGGDDVTIKLGDAIRWVNLDPDQHTATSTSTPMGGNAFDSGLMNNGDTFRFVPDARGEWIYFCELHPSIMVDARIIVE